MIEIKVEKANVTVMGSGKSTDVAEEAMMAMVAALKTIRECDNTLYMSACKFIQDGHLFEMVERGE